MTTQPLKIGFIGLGIMGAPMAGHLIKAGHQLFVYTHGKVPAEIAESSATQCLNARGVADVFTLYASHHRYGDNCFQIVVSRTQLLLTAKGLTARSQDWDTVFVSRTCIAPKDKGMRFAGHEGGGRLALLDDDTLLLSTGVYQFDGVDGDYRAGQDAETDLGKIIAISLSTGKARIYAYGLRNPQGLQRARQGFDNILLRNAPIGGVPAIL
jgi:hypothetical protein